MAGSSTQEKWKQVLLTENRLTKLPTFQMETNNLLQRSGFLFVFEVLYVFDEDSFNKYRKQAIRLDERETSCQVVACYIRHSMIWSDQPQ